MDSAGKRSQSQKPAHGPPLQARVVAANRTVLTTLLTILAHMEMNRGQRKIEQNGARTLRRAVGMAWQGRAGTHSLLSKAAAGEHSRRTIRPAQALSQNNGQQLAASQQNNSRRRRWPASLRAVQVGGGSAVVPATQKGGLRPTYLSPSHLSPLPVTVSTHSLNLYKPNLAPTYFFVVFIFIFPSTSPL